MMTRRDFIRYLAALAIIPGSLKLLAREPRPALRAKPLWAKVKVLDEAEPIKLKPLGMSHFYDGYISEVRVYNRSLSPAEIQAIFEKHFSGSPLLLDSFGISSDMLWPETQPTQEMVDDAVVTLEDLKNFWEHVR